MPSGVNAIALYSGVIAVQQTVSFLDSNHNVQNSVSISINCIIGHHSCNQYPLLICAFLHLLEVHNKLWMLQHHYCYMDIYNSILKIHNSYMDLHIQFIYLLASSAVCNEGLEFHYGLHTHSH